MKENSEQSVYTTAAMPNITTVTNSSIMSSTASTYSSEGPLRICESIYTGLTSKSSQPHTVMSSGLSTNPYRARPKVFENQNPNSLYLHNLPRAHSTMYTPSTNSYVSSIQSNLPGGWDTTHNTFRKTSTYLNLSKHIHKLNRYLSLSKRPSSHHRLPHTPILPVYILKNTLQ